MLLWEFRDFTHDHFLNASSENPQYPFEMLLWSPTSSGHIPPYSLAVVPQLKDDQISQPTHS
jgi:hypothetical protein